jgi:hypothetical protein
MRLHARYLVALIYTRLAAFCDDHGSPLEVDAKSKEWRQRLLNEMKEKKRKKEM